MLAPTPLLAMWQEWHDKCFHCHQPVLALLSGITSFSALMGRSYRGPTSAIPPLMIIGLADSGLGKSVPLAMASHMMKAVGCERLLGASSWGSSSGVTDELTEKGGEILWLADEFAHMFHRLNSPSCPTYFKDITFYLKTWYDGMSDRGRSLKGETAKNAIEDPRVAIYATTQPGVLWPAIKSEYIIDGLIGRFLVVPAALLNVTPRHHKPVPPQECMPEGIKTFVQRSLETIGSYRSGPTRILDKPYFPIPYRNEAAEDLSYEISLAAQKRRNAYYETGEMVEGALVGRTFERVIRLAAVYAWTETPDLNIAVSEAGLRWALKLVQVSDRNVLAALTKSEGASPKSQPIWERYADIIRQATHRDPKGIAQSVLIRRTKCAEDEHKKILKQLASGGVIQLVEGKHGFNVRWIEDETIKKEATP